MPALQSPFMSGSWKSGKGWGPLPGWKKTRETENLNTMHELEQDPQQPRESLKQVALVTLKTDTPSICRVVVLCIWNAPPGLTWIPGVQLLDLLWKAMGPLRGGAPLKEVGHWWQTCSLTARPHFLCPCCTLVSPCRPVSSLKLWGKISPPPLRCLHVRCLVKATRKTMQHYSSTWKFGLFLRTRGTVLCCRV